jgi:DNA-directed RNA polymerase specialized sigma24 family protein
MCIINNFIDFKNVSWYDLHKTKIHFGGIDMTAEKESEIIEKYYNEIRNYIKSRMRDDDFEAVTQETFIVFIRKLRTEKISSERGYLYFIAKAKIGDYYRQKNKILKH